MIVKCQRNKESKSYLWVNSWAQERALFSQPHQDQRVLKTTKTNNNNQEVEVTVAKDNVIVNPVTVTPLALMTEEKEVDTKEVTEVATTAAEEADTTEAAKEAVTTVVAKEEDTKEEDMTTMLQENDQDLTWLLVPETLLNNHNNNTIMPIFHHLEAKRRNLPMLKKLQRE